MNEIKPWWYVFAELKALTYAGVKSAVPVKYDFITGTIEILDINADCCEWVVRAEDIIDQNWIARLNSRFDVQPIYMEGSTIVDFKDDWVRINAEGQKLLFNQQMKSDFGQLMTSFY